MKTLKTLFFFFLLVFGTGLFSACKEENVQPRNKEGNITGQDDWGKTQRLVLLVLLFKANY